MRRKPIFPLRREELEAMHTGSLLKRLEQLHRCEESFEMSDMYPDEVPQGQVVFKNTEEWIRAYHDVKAVLATRENVDKGKERAQKRKPQARERAHRRRDR
nr:hypothetical protein [uncultured bacterium]